MLSHSQNPSHVAGIFIQFQAEKATQIQLVNSLLNKKKFISVPLLQEVPMYTENNFRMRPLLSIWITKERFRFSITASALGPHIITHHHTSA